ncbi:MAG TPA: DUF6754 domain-containing protein [bacterium]|nr:DUF6754 domain-containing protein [bacterium]
MIDLSGSAPRGARLGLAVLAAALLATASVRAQTAPAAPVDLGARDTPNDGGRSITVTWTAPPNAEEGSEVVIERIATDGTAEEVATVPLADGVFLDAASAQGAQGPPNRVPFAYRFTAVTPDGVRSTPVVSTEAMARGQLFHGERWNVLLMISLLFGFVLYNVSAARRGAGAFYVRRLAPVDAIEEAIGRATEMGRPVLYVPGIEDVEDIQTIASMLILEKVAEKTATYDVPLEVPTRTPFVLAVADEVVRTGCSAAGRPDAYRPDSVRYISSEQFAYCAGVNGIILRDKPAANLYLGRFFAESLIFAETGFAAGSIQIAGTAEVTQLPFFIAACDYTLIGEEFFAASAYMSQDPSLLSTLKAADWAKVVLVTLLLIGTILESMGQPWFREWFQVR